MRLKLLVLLVLYSGLVDADWTGVAVELGNVDADWKFSDGIREMDSTSISFMIEEKTTSGLTVGGGIGYLSIRVAGDSASSTRRFDAEYLQIYLRQDIPVSASFGLLASLDYRYNTGNDDDNADDRAEIEWTAASFMVGASVRFKHLRITPFAVYHNIDGDISDDSGTDAFELDDPISKGIRFDYFLEDTAFISLELESGDQEGGLLTFVRRY
jgi:hypothetical protein